MNENFENAFETLFSEFPSNLQLREFDYFSPFTVSSLREIRNYIILQVSESEKIIRADAKFYLLNNYTYMVLLPYLMTSEYSDSRYPVDEKFIKKIKSDINLIIERSNSIDKEEISSHVISIAINDVWDKLFSTSEAFWTKPDHY